MKRMLPGLLLLILLASSTLSAAVSHKVFQTGTAGTPIVIAILADHYTDEAKFENDVKNFLTYGLLAHPYYADHANDLQIETFFEAVSAGEMSKYGFNVEVPSQNCLLSWEIGTTDATNTWLKISAVVGGINPKHTIVIGDHPYSMGCTEGEWTYVAEDAAGTDILAHELGHGIGQLYDEWVIAAHIGDDHPGLSADPEIARNCHDLRHGATPPWPNPAAGAYPGCDLYEGKVVHAYQHMTMYASHSYCLMGPANNAEFCPVCRHYMDQEFEYLENPWASNSGVMPPYIQNSGTRDPQHPPPPPPGAGTRPPVPPPHQSATHGVRTPVPAAPPSGMRIMRVAFFQTPKPDKPVVPAPQPVTPSKPVPTPKVVPTSKPETSLIIDPSIPRPIVRLVVSFDPVKGGIVARKAFPITARYVPSYRRLGEYVYEIVEGNQTREVGVLPSSLFRAHGYQGGAGHSTSPPHPTDITIQMPDVTGDALKDPARNFSIRIWRLMPGVTDKLITPSVFANLRNENRVESRGQLAPDQIRSVM